jgi:hypothetical protein
VIRVIRRLGHELSEPGRAELARQQNNHYQENQNANTHGNLAARFEHLPRLEVHSRGARRALNGLRLSERN